MDVDYPLAIIGSGIAGLSAAIYAGRAGNDPIIIKGDEPGGQLTLTTDVANYPGFPEGISGPELVQRMNDQASQFGAEFQNAIVEDITKDNDVFTITFQSGEQLTVGAVIVASGASARTLGIPGEDELMGHGVSTCATCDGAFFQGEDMIVVGGGDAALEEAAFLTKFASTVYLVHRREEFRAEQIWQDKIQEHVDAGDVELVLNSEVTEVTGSPENGVDHATVVTHPDGRPTERLDDPETETRTMDVGAFFVAIGHTPNTGFLDGMDVERDDAGYLETVGGSAGETRTGVPGLFGAGDVVDKHYQQAATASGMGVKAALDVDAYLNE